MSALVRRTAALLLVAFTAACAGSERTEWDPAAVRSLARHIAEREAGQQLVVAATGGPDQAELPWGVRQSLTTGGLAIGDTTAHRTDGVVLLVLERSARSDDAWLIDTRLERTGGSTQRESWVVRCTDAGCNVRSTE